MSAPRRRQFYWLIALMAVGAIAELATIGSVVPFVSLLANPAGFARFRWMDFGAALGLDPLAAGAVLFASLVVVAGAIRLQLAWSVQNFSYLLGHEIMIAIQRRVLLQPYRFHIQQNTSTLLAAIEKVEVLVFDVLLPTMQALAATVLAIFIIAALVWIDPFIALVAASASAALYLLVSAAARKRLAENSDAIGRSYNERMKIAQESLGSIRDVIIDGTQDAYVRLFERIDLQLCIARANTAFLASAPRFMIETVGILVIAAIAVAGAQREGGLAGALPVLGAIAFGAQRLLPLLQQIYHSWSTASGYVSVVGQTAELLRLPVEPSGRAAGAVRPLPLRDRITVEDVSFAYPTRRGSALADVSFEIPAGSAIALVGETGSGKSTLADILMGLLEPDDGRICIDGTRLTNANRPRWQRSIAHVPQSIFLADTSIARNIALALGDEPVDLAQVIDAARKAQLNSFIQSLPDGYETVIGERGIRLSGGQRQRLGLARAIYKRAPVLVLDEATSGLDEATEAAVIDSLDELRKQGRTIIIIAHRRSTIARVDLVVTLEKGRIASIGKVPKAPRNRARSPSNRPGRRGASRSDQ